MTKKSRNILIIASLIILVFTGITGYGLYSMYSFFTQFGLSREIPDEIKHPRITVGAKFLEKKEFFKIKEDGLLQIIAERAKAQDEKEKEAITQSKTAKVFYGFADLDVIGNEIIAVGVFGGFVFDLNGKLKREFQFEPTKEKVKIGLFEKEDYKINLDNLQIVPLEKNKYGFFSYGLSDGVTIFDKQGKIIWEYGKKDFVLLESISQSEAERRKSFDEETYVLEATVGDLDNDGISEYIVANKNIGIQAFNQKGERLWIKKDEFPSDKLIIEDLNNDGKNELLEVGSKIRDKNGEIIRELKGVSLNDAFLFRSDENQQRTINFCDFYAGEISCSDLEDKEVFRAKSPLSEIKLKNPRKIEIPVANEPDIVIDSENIAFPKAVWVKFKKDEPQYLAIVGAYGNLPRAGFYVYTSNGELVYHELLSEGAGTIAVLPKSNGIEEILIGGKDTIWKFTAK